MPIRFSTPLRWTSNGPTRMTSSLSRKPSKQAWLEYLIEQIEADGVNLPSQAGLEATEEESPRMKRVGACNGRQCSTH